MAPLIHSDSLHFDTPVESYWQASADPLGISLPALKSDISCDVAIIGSGFTGLSAAIELAQSGIDVCLVEAGPIGWGASGRNGGFACMGSHKLSYAAMIKTYGLAATQHFYRTLKESVALVAETCRHFAIDAWLHGEGEVTLAHLPNRMTELRAEKEFVHATFGDAGEILSREQLRERGLFAPHFYGGLRRTVGFGVHPLNYVRGLARAAHGSGVKLHANARILRWEQTATGHALHTASGKISATRVLVATNGYTPEDVSTFHAGRVLPALSSIIVTRPLTTGEQQTQGWTSSTLAYDSRNLLHYFRLLPNGRFLFGGRGGTDSSNAGAQNYRHKITAAFFRLFPEWGNAEITHYWRGHVCIAYDRVPYVGALDDRKTVWTALAYHGNGIAMGSWCGRAVARMMQDKSAAGEVPAVITRRLARFPLPMFRPVYLKGAYVWYGWQDLK